VSNKVVQKERCGQQGKKTLLKKAGAHLDQMGFSSLHASSIFLCVLRKHIIPNRRSFPLFQNTDDYDSAQDGTLLEKTLFWLTLASKALRAAISAKNFCEVAARSPSSATSART
jgi:hypothetical protein